ncbi:MAG: hypothetical protein EXS52_01635 [Candidatus Staskawiczbacteria bacterium]|nr:hypothetical protein [Candidatus Staskawiczbacteria bacterium]
MFALFIVILIFKIYTFYHIIKVIKKPCNNQLPGRSLAVFGDYLGARLLTGGIIANCDIASVVHDGLGQLLHPSRPLILDGFIPDPLAKRTLLRFHIHGMCPPVKKAKIFPSPYHTMKKLQRKKHIIGFAYNVLGL